MTVHTSEFLVNKLNCSAIPGEIFANDHQFQINYVASVRIIILQDNREWIISHATYPVPIWWNVDLYDTYLPNYLPIICQLSRNWKKSWLHVSIPVVLIIKINIIWTSLKNPFLLKKFDVYSRELNKHVWKYD